VNVVDHIDEVAVLFVRLDTGVVDVGGSTEIVDLGFAILVSNDTALLGSKS